MPESKKNLDKPLDDNFYQKTLRPDRQQSYKLIAKFIKRIMWPDINSAIDYGCGAGWILFWLKHYGVDKLLGYEPNAHAKAVMDEAIKPLVKRRSVSKPIKQQERFDLAISLEVAEHIEEKYADVYISNIIQGSDLLIFSAATPGQGGYGHINEQPFDYWEEKLLLEGFKCNRESTEKLRTYLTSKNAKKWYCNNIAVFEREK